VSELNAFDPAVELFGGTAYAEGSTVVTSAPVHILHMGRHLVHIPAHSRGGVPIKSHWRAMPQGVAAPSNAEPVELFGGKSSTSY